MVKKKIISESQPLEFCDFFFSIDLDSSAPRTHREIHLTLSLYSRIMTKKYDIVPHANNKYIVQIYFNIVQSI